MKHFLPILALIAPLIALVLEQALPYPYVVEEVLKFFLIVPLVNKKQNFLLLAGLIGFNFGFTEAVLYAQNIFLIGGSFAVLRIISSLFLHTLTAIVIYLISKLHKLAYILALLTAISIHFGYNTYLL